MAGKARIVVTLVCEYEGEDVDEYNEAMEIAGDAVRDVGDDIADSFQGLRVLEVTVTG